MKTVYDAMFYAGQPAMHRRGLTPLLMLDDGLLHRATVPEGVHVGADTAAAAFAFRRVARDAIAAEPGIRQNTYKTPPAYDAVPQAVCIDFERESFRLDIDMSAPPARRQAAVGWLCRGIDAMRDEANCYGRTITIGSYYPLLPLYWGDGRDARCPGWRDAATHDYAPLLERLDASHPGCEIHGDDLEQWKADTRATVDALKAAMPGKPIYPVLPPHYSHFAEEAKRFTPLPLSLWRDACAWILDQPDVAGVTLWGGADLRDDPNRRLPWAAAEPYVAAARMTALTRK